MNPSRRRVLAALATVGGAGALSGVGTSAVLRDEARFGGGLTAGVVDIVGKYWLLSGPGSGGTFDPSAPDGTVDGPRVDVPVGTLGDGHPRGSMLLRVALPQREGAVNNPASLWLRTDCPPRSTLAEFLQVRLSYAGADGSRGATIADGSLREVADALRTGYHLDPAGDPTNESPDCLTDELFVLVEYDVGGYVGSETTDLPLFLAAVQCRNADPQASPFPPGAIDAECEVGHVCDCCWAIGKVETDAPLQSGQTYAFDEGIVDYALHVTDVDGDAGVAFDLVSPGGGTVPPLCEVQVKGGPVDETYHREPGEFGFDTSVLDGSVDGLVYAPPNPNSGSRYGISYVLVKVCAPTVDGGNCPDDLVRPAASVGGPGGSGARPQPPDGKQGKPGGTSEQSDANPGQPGDEPVRTVEQGGGAEQ